ncbi:hypothetical protein MKW92_031652 [Papaver armeniacum]|nr:hypothetical protein MKW92_031652 [Papaver armeniacum]
MNVDEEKTLFSGKGGEDDVGEEGGNYYSLNIPLNDGIDDTTFLNLCLPIIGEVIRVFDPEAIVLQAGADSLYRDKIGKFNLSIEGHAECLKHLITFNIPLILLSGGGYTIQYSFSEKKQMERKYK